MVEVTNGVVVVEEGEELMLDGFNCCICLFVAF
jgi:hypothetical protein